MDRIRKQIEKSRQRIANERRKMRDLEAQRKAKLRAKATAAKRRPGRPRIDENLIIKAIQKAETKPLADVALSLDVALSTLYKYGVTRKALEEEKNA